VLLNENGHITSSWSKVEQGIPQGSILGPLLFLLFINDLPKFLNDTSAPILFADDTSILILHQNSLIFYKTINDVLQTLNAWFKQNLLSLNLAKTHFIKFVSKNNKFSELNINFGNKSISVTDCTRFLGLTINCTLTWTNHIDLLTNKLSSTCFLIRNIKPYIPFSALKMIYHSFFHSVMSYGIIFWGNSKHSQIIFKMQKRVVRTLMGCGYRDSCRGLFRELKILTLTSQYILSVLLFVVQNEGHFATNNAYHEFNTRRKKDLHLPHTSLTMYQRGVFYSGVKLFNSLPATIKDTSSNPTKFKAALKLYLLTHSFYDLEEFYSEQNT
jgi:hypothetical protein